MFDLGLPRLCWLILPHENSSIFRNCVRWLTYCEFEINHVLVCSCCCNRTLQTGSVRNNRDFFLIVLEARRPRSRRQAIQFLGRPPLLVFRGLSPGLFSDAHGREGTGTQTWEEHLFLSLQGRQASGSGTPPVGAHLSFLTS